MSSIIFKNALSLFKTFNSQSLPRSFQIRLSLRFVSLQRFPAPLAMSRKLYLRIATAKTGSAAYPYEKKKHNSNTEITYIWAKNMLE